MGCEQLSSASKLHAMFTPVLLPNVRIRLHNISLLIGRLDGMSKTNVRGRQLIQDLWRFSRQKDLHVRIFVCLPRLVWQLLWRLLWCGPMEAQLALSFILFHSTCIHIPSGQEHYSKLITPAHYMQAHALTPLPTDWERKMWSPPSPPWQWMISRTVS